MYKIVKRGFSPNDNKEFNETSIQKLFKAGKDVFYLLNRGYSIKSSSQFVGNHYLLSERQRLALVRAIASLEKLEIRKSKEQENIQENSIVNIDGFNIIITLEVALSNSILLKCMDGSIRDLAGLRGTYHVIDKTPLAIEQIRSILKLNKIKKAIFYLDAPVSNSRKLKELIIEIMSGWGFIVEVQIIDNVDKILKTLNNVITSDAAILDVCKSWINLNNKIITGSYIDFGFLSNGFKL